VDASMNILRELIVTSGLLVIIFVALCFAMVALVLSFGSPRGRR